MPVMSRRTAFFVAVALLGFALGTDALAAPDAAAERFAKIKALAGDWTLAGGDGSVAVTYRVTAAGTAVVETLFPGSPHEMVTVYTVDKGDLVLTHYCAEGNQPHMKATKGADAGTIDFAYDGAGNMKSEKEGHMHEASFSFVDADHVKSTWQYYKDGKPGERKVIDIVRKKS